MTDQLLLPPLNLFNCSQTGSLARKTETSISSSFCDNKMSRSTESLGSFSKANFLSFVIFTFVVGIDFSAIARS